MRLLFRKIFYTPRTLVSSKRISREICSRLKLLTDQELRVLTERPSQDQAYILKEILKPFFNASKIPYPPPDLNIRIKQVKHISSKNKKTGPQLSIYPWSAKLKYRPCSIQHSLGGCFYVDYSVFGI